MTSKYFFLHLQKTAGTSLWRRLHQHFADEAIYPDASDGRPPDTTLLVEHLRKRWTVRADEIQLVTGHFPLCTTELLGGGFTTFTVLREPIERILSALRQQSQRPGPLAGAPLESVYDEPVRNQLIRNHMVKMLSITTDEMDAGALTHVDFTHDRLERVKRALATVDVVGFQDDFESFCGELSARFGWDLGPAEYVNRSRAGDPVDDAFVTRLREENALDIELYDHACRLFR